MSTKYMYTLLDSLIFLLISRRGSMIYVVNIVLLWITIDKLSTSTSILWSQNITMLPTPVYVRYDWRMKSSGSRRTKRMSRTWYKDHWQKSTSHLPVHLRRLFLIYAACIVASGLTASVLVLNRKTTPLPDPFSVSQRSAVPFTLYYPKALPTPFYIDIASLGRLQESVVAIRIIDGKGQSFMISQQALPPTIDLEALYQGFGSRTSFAAKLGKVTTGTIDDGSTRVVSLVSEDNTWLLVQAPISVKLSDIQTALEELAPSR